MSLQLWQMVCFAPLHHSWEVGLCEGYRGQNQWSLF